MKAARLAVVLGAAALASVAWPIYGKFLAIALGVAVLFLAVPERRGATLAHRSTAVVGIVLGSASVLLGAAKYAMSLTAAITISRLLHR